MDTRAKSGLKVLLYDCESFPNIGYTWGAHEQSVLKVIRPRMVVSIAWQWFPSKKVEVLALPDFPGYDPKNPDNSALIKAFGNQLEKADVVVGQNIEQFDNPMVNTDLLKQGLASPPHYRTVDTLKLLRQKFRFNSNKLGEVCQELGVGKKVKHEGFGLWEKCMAGDLKAWATMRAYNVHDVVLLRGLYDRLKSWFPNHPNLSVAEKRPCCPFCRHDVLSSDGWRHTQAASYRRMICTKCHARSKLIQKKDGSFVYRP